MLVNNSAASMLKAIEHISAQATIVSTDSFGPYSLALELDNAIWLAQVDSSVRQIVILLCPVVYLKPIFSLKLILKRFINSILRVLFRVSSASILRSKYLASRFYEIHNFSQNPHSAYTQLCQHGRLDLKPNISLEITILRPGCTLRNWITLFLSSLHSYFLIWRDSHPNGSFCTQAFLKICYLNVRIGDLVASEFLRHSLTASGSLIDCLKLQEILFSGLMTTNYAKKLPDFTSKLYVRIPERSYIQAIYERLFLLKGATLIDRDYDRLIEPQAAVANKQSWSQYSSSGDDLEFSEQKAAEVTAYLKERVKDPSIHLSYMRPSTAPKCDRLILECGRPVELNSKDLCAVLFLHSFADAQYEFGVDGFSDLFDWTSFSIQALLSNPLIKNVFLKEHPNSDYKRYPVDLFAVSRIRKLFGLNSKLKWLSPRVGVSAFSSCNNIIALTHHGSIAEELAYIGIPVIASSFAPWSDRYSFLTTWRTPMEYREILFNLSGSILQNKTSSRCLRDDSLLAFVFRYRFLQSRRYRIRVWRDYVQFKSGFFPNDDVSSYDCFLRSISSMSIESLNEFSAYLQCLYLRVS